MWCVNTGLPGQRQVCGKALGLTTFYYPHELMEGHDYIEDPYGPNYEAMYRIRQCENGPQVRRNIPYCIPCMIKYVNFGEREDGLEVPFGSGNRHAIYNL